MGLRSQFSFHNLNIKQVSQENTKTSKVSLLLENNLKPIRQKNRISKTRKNYFLIIEIGVYVQLKERQYGTCNLPFYDDNGWGKRREI